MKSVNCVVDVVLLTQYFSYLVRICPLEEQNTVVMEGLVSILSLYFS